VLRSSKDWVGRVRAPAPDARRYARTVITTQPERTTALGLAVFGAFQGALAAGAPWGRAAYGGTYYGKLPRRLRTISGMASVVYFCGAVLVLRGSGTARARRRAFTALSIFMSVGVIANGGSRSPAERVLWTPLAAVSAVSSWRSRPGDPAT
jgi:hypothetical protein